MLPHSNLFLLAAVLISSHLVDSRGLLAQPIWLDRNHERTLALEILKPDFTEDENTTFATSALFLSGRIVATNNISVVGEIPFAHSHFNDYATENAFGNPYLGIEIHDRASPIFAELGIRLPLVPENDNQIAVLLGTVTDFVDRAEAFVPNAFPVSGALNYYYNSPGGFVLRLRGGSAGWIASGDRDESEWFLLYSAQAGYEWHQGNFVAGLSGRWLLTEEDIDFSERTLHQLGLAVNFAIGELQPGVSCRVPLDKDVVDNLDFIFGLTLGMNLN